MDTETQEKSNKAHPPPLPSFSPNLRTEILADDLSECLVGNLQGHDVGREGVRHGSDALAQRVIFGAGASCGTPGLPHPPRITEDQADSGQANQERPSSVCPARVSHSCCPAPVSDHSRSCNLRIINGINPVVVKTLFKNVKVFGKKQKLQKL